MGGPSAAHCKEANNSLTAARAIREKHPQIAAEQYKKAAQSARNAGDTTLELSILREATAAGDDTLASSQPRAAGSVSNPFAATPDPQTSRAKEAALRPDQSVARSSAGGDCSEVKENIDWVFRDGGAQRTYAQQRAVGKSDFDAIVDAQAHNPRVQALLRRCQAVAEAYLGARNNPAGFAGLPDDVRKQLDDAGDDPDRQNKAIAALPPEYQERAKEHVRERRIADKRTPKDPKDSKPSTQVKGTQEGSEQCWRDSRNPAVNNTAAFYQACGSLDLYKTGATAMAGGPTSDPASNTQAARPQNNAGPPPTIAALSAGMQRQPGASGVVDTSGPAGTGQPLPSSPAARVTTLAIEPQNVVAQARASCARFQAGSADWKTCTTVQEAALIMKADAAINAACGSIKDEAARAACAINAYVKQLDKIAADENCYYDNKGRHCYPAGSGPAAAGTTKEGRRATLREKLLANKLTRGQSGDVTEEEVFNAEEEAKKQDAAAQQLARASQDLNLDDPLQNYLHSGNMHSRNVLDNSGQIIGPSRSEMEKNLEPEPPMRRQTDQMLKGEQYGPPNPWRR